MTERFKKAYDALVRAYFEGTLAKYSCVACACGNIIFDAVGSPITKEQMKDLIYFTDATNSISQDLLLETTGRATDLMNKACSLWADKRSQSSWDHKYVSKEKYLGVLNAAGYATEEFAEIENAFESNTSLHIHYYLKYSEQEILEDQYRGLCAVVDVLIKLDESKEDPDELKKKFREHPKLQVA